MQDATTKESLCAAEHERLVHIGADGTCGLVEVRWRSSVGDSEALHLCFFVDRAFQARWGEPDGDAQSGREAKRRALQRLRATPSWGDAPDCANRDECKTLDRLGTTPVWGCAALLAHLLVAEARFAGGCRPRRIVELGAGLGVPGFLAARLWPDASVAITDTGDSLVELLRRNLSANFCGANSNASKRPRRGRTVIALDLGFGGEAAAEAVHGPLGKLGGPAELVIVSDCFFYPWYGDTWTPLRASLLELCDQTTLVLLGTRHRDGGRVSEALDCISQLPFHRRVLQQRDVVCDICGGEGYIDFDMCWECEGTGSQGHREEVWLLSKSEDALVSWKSCTEGKE